jgi:hypothetical protein
MSKTLYSENVPMFHPSIFETTTADTPEGTNIVKQLEKERLKKLVTDDLNKLKSPGNFGLNGSMLDDEKIAETNTKYMSKTLFEETLLTQLYFSRKNVENIQNVVKYKVFQQTNQVIDTQNTTELLIVMRSIYLEYSAHPPIIKNDMDEEMKKKLLKMYTDEILRLNQLVIEYVFPNVLSQLQQYISYLRDASTPPYQQIQPTSSDNVKGQRQYRSITQVLLGTDL